MKFAVNELTKSASRALSALYTKFVPVGGMDCDIFCKYCMNLGRACVIQWCLDLGSKRTEKPLCKIKHVDTF